MKTHHTGAFTRHPVRNSLVAGATLGGLLLSCAFVPQAALAAESTLAPYAADAPWTKTVTYLVSQLTPAEKQKLVRGGAPVGGPTGVNELDPDPHGQAGYLSGIKRLGIPETRHVDALGINVSGDATAGPSRLGLASSFSRELFSEFGTLVGEEGVESGMTLIYGPQADLARTPSWSRNNTAYSEDAYVANELLETEVEGIQGAGLMSQVKHVGMYNGQAQATPSIVEGQAAHEIYLAPAEKAAEVGVSSMMCSYATFLIKDDSRYTKSDYACENSVLMNDIIKTDWGFDGFITSDYNALHATSDILAGVDQEFATSFLSAANLLPLLDTSSASYEPAYVAAVDQAIARTLYQDERFGLLDNDYIPEQFESSVPQHGDVDTYDNTVTIDKAKGVKAAEELAERAAVLLKNDNDVLPLSTSTSVNVVGQVSTLLPASPGGERAQGFGDRVTISPYKGLKAIGGSKVSSNPGIDLLGTTIPAANLKQADGTTAGLTRSTTPVGGSTTTSVDTVLDGKQTNLVKGTAYSWTGNIVVPSTGDYQIQIQRPYGKDNGDDNSYNDGISRATGGTVSFAVDGTNKTLANPDSNILQNAVPSFAVGTSNKVVADNGQYLGYDNTGVTLTGLSAGNHTITLNYTPAATLPVNPTIRLSWSDKGAAVASAVAAAATNDVSVVFADDSGSTGGDGASTSTDVKSLSAAQNSLINQVAAAAHANGKKVVVVLNTGSAIQTPWIDDVDGILEMWYPGQEGGTATAKLLYGEANPSGHLTISFPKSSAQSLFGVTDTNGNGSIGAGDENWERSNATTEAGETVASFKWTEGLNIGYRWFTDPTANTNGYDPQFAFGHGLSYTDFEYSNLSSKTGANGSIDVTFTVKNIGERKGYDVPQVYVGPSTDLDPAKFEQTALKLVQFDDVKLAAGESKTLTLNVEAKDLSSYSTENNNYVLGTGARSIYLGAASNDIRLTSSAKVVSNAAAPAVTTQPAATATARAGETVTLTAAASGTPTPTVRWQQSTNAGSTWTDIPGATSTTLSIAAPADGTQFRAVFTNDLGTAVTSATVFTLKATPVAPVVTTQPVSTSVKVGATVVLSSTATGNPAPVVQWQVSANKGATWTNIAGATATTYSFTAKASDSGKQYRAAFSSTAGSANSKAAALVVKKISTTTKVALAKKTISTKKKATVVVTVSPKAEKATGKVTLHYGSKTKTVTLKASDKGKISVKLPKLKKGSYTIYATYAGNSTLASDTSGKVTLKVK